MIFPVFLFYAAFFLQLFLLSLFKSFGDGPFDKSSYLGFSL